MKPNVRIGTFFYLALLVWGENTEERSKWGRPASKKKIRSINEHCSAVCVDQRLVMKQISVAEAEFEMIYGHIYMYVYSNFGHIAAC